MFPRYLIIFLFAFVCNINASAQIGPKGEFIEKKNVIESGYNFWIYSPEEYKEDKHPLPLIVFLHGASLCGRNLSKVRRYGVLDAIDKGMIIPMFVVAPQNPGGAWNPSKLNDLMEWMKQNYAIDESRIYVLGMSLGGYGTMDFAGTYPDKIAAAMALCGGCSLREQSGLGELPLWIMHGTADRAVSVNESKKVVSFLQKENNDKLLRHDWIEGGSHGVLARLFYLQKTYDWLLSHSLGDNPRTVDRDFDITWEDLKSGYIDTKNNVEYYDND